MRSLLLAIGAISLLAGPALASPKLDFPVAKPGAGKIDGLAMKTRTFDDPTFNFHLAVPGDWGRVTAGYALDKVKAEPQTLALYRSTAMPPAEIEVQVFPLPREVSPIPWLGQLIAGLGAQTVDQRIHAGPDPIPEALVRRTLKGKDYVFRVAAFKNGDRMFVVWGRSDAKAYSKYAEAFAQAVGTFQLTNPQKKRYAEALQSARFEAPFAATVKVPESWTAKVLAKAPDLASTSFQWKLADQVLGSMAVRLYPASEEAPAAFLPVFKEDMKSLGVSLGAPTLDQKMSAKGPRQAGLLRVYPGTRGDAGVEAHVCVMKLTGGWAVLALVSPDLKANEAALHINRRAFEIAVAELTPNGGS